MIGQEWHIMPAMRTLMTPDDESSFVRFVTGELRFDLLTTTLVVDGEAAVAEDPLVALPAELPRPWGGADEVVGFTFWCRRVGRLRTVAETPRPQSSAEATWRETMEDRYPGGWQDHVDPWRSPVIRLRRSVWTADGSLRPGRVDAMSEGALLDDMPPSIRLSFRRTKEWLMLSSLRIPPPPEIARRRQGKREVQALVVWALPDAARWVAEGGQIAWE